MEDCKHLIFTCESRVGRMVEEHELPIGTKVLPLDFKVDIKIHCSDCKKRLRFRGMPMGVHRTKPTVSADEFEARLTAEVE
jgi:hypothetical protein